MSDQRVLLSFVHRTDSPSGPEDVCPVCLHFIKLDQYARATLAAGGKVVCIICARELERRRPGTFSDETVAKMSPTAYPESA